jgi:hypothetical protein
MDQSVVTGLFTLGGVVVGGAVNGGVTYAMERSRAGWAARRSARLFAPALYRLAFAAAHAEEHTTTYADLARVAEANLTDWPEHSAVFAGTLEWEQWFGIYAAVRAWEGFTWNLPPDPERTEIRPSSKGAAYVSSLGERAVEGAVQCSSIALRGVRRRRLRGALTSVWRRLRPLDEDKLIEQAGEKAIELPDDFDAHAG